MDAKPTVPQGDAFAHLRAALAAGCRIQVWRLVEGAASSGDGHWVTLPAPEFACPAHLYRVHPDDVRPADCRALAERLEDRLRGLWSYVQEARTTYAGYHSSGTFRRIGERIESILDTLTREPSTPSAQAVGHVCRDVSQARMVANLPEGTALYATPSAQADDLKWLGSTTAGIRLASMLRDEVKAGDFRQALAEVIALVRQSTPSAQVSGGGEAHPIWLLMNDGEVVSVSSRDEGQTEDDALKRHLKGGVRSLKQAKLQGYSVTPGFAIANLSTPQARPDATFAEWLASEMPAGTVIGDTAWWANRIARQYAARCTQARPDDDLAQRMAAADARYDVPPCLECGAVSAKDAEDKCHCSGDKDDCHGCQLWPDGEPAPTADGGVVAWRFWVDDPSSCLNPDWSAWSTDPAFRRLSEKLGYRAEFAHPTPAPDAVARLVEAASKAKCACPPAGHWHECWKPMLDEALTAAQQEGAS